MKNRLIAAIGAAAVALVVTAARTPAWSQAPAAATSAGATKTSPKTWVGHYQEYEDFIRAAEIDRFEDVPIGVTKPKRAYFKPGGMAESVAWKMLPPGRPQGYWESYKSEIAAYELDKVLGLEMVPPTVEKKWKHDVAAAMLWLSPVRQWKEAEKMPKPPGFDRQVVKMKMFDNLIGNIDRNMGNLLVDDDWNLFLIDHSRAFVSDKSLPFKMTYIHRELWDRMLTLDEPTLTAAIGKWVVGKGEIRAILARRDKMTVEIDKLVKAKSEATVFVR